MEKFDRAILRDVFERIQKTGRGPAKATFRVEREGDRHRIDSLVSTGHLVEANDAYDLTIKGLEATQLPEAEAQLARADIVLEALKAAYRAEPLRKWSVKDFADRSQLDPTVVSRALWFVLQHSVAATTSGSGGVVTGFRLQESVLDTVPIRSPHKLGEDDQIRLGNKQSAPRATKGDGPGAAGTSFNRELEAGDRPVLGARVYAAALATLLRTATGEFCVALFGRWGIGKTTLSRIVEPLLANPEAYSTAMDDLGFAAADDPPFKLKYDVVRFSAWKFRRPPELWVFLYETFAEKAQSGPVPQRLARALRAGVQRQGYWKLLIEFAAIALVGIPTISLLGLVYPVLTFVGIGAIAYLARTTYRGRRTLTSFAGVYAAVTRHNEKLGMQALIGDDLKALLMAWIPNEPFVKQPALIGGGLLGIVAAVWGWALIYQPQIVIPLGTSSLSTHAGTQWPYWVALSAWVLGAVACVWAVHRPSRTTHRILLIVDDLDRCEPDEIVNLIDSIKLLVEDEEIQRRVQVLMLVDELVLRHAIEIKFKSLIGQVGDSQARQVVDEHIEKLFACYLRLPNLNSADITDLSEVFARGAAKSNGIAKVAPEESASAEGSASSPHPVVPPNEARRTPNTLAGEPFSRSEIEAITGELARRDNGAMRRSLSPRLVRAFFFKYQLCRLVLRLSQGNQADDGPNNILTSLGDAVFGLQPAESAEAIDNSPQTARDSISSIVRQVA